MDTSKLRIREVSELEEVSKELYILIEKLEYALCIAGLSFKGQVRSNLYTYKDQYVMFMCCRDFTMHKVQLAKIKEFGTITETKPEGAKLLIKDEALEKLSFIL